MKRGATIVAGLAAGLVLCTWTYAIGSNSSDDPYGAIVGRNLFALKPPEKAPNPEDNKPPPPKITLQGITSVLGRRQVLFKASVSPKPGEPAKELALVLSEGQSENEFEVLEIDEESGTVKFNNHGTIQSLSLEKDGSKLPAGVMPPAMSASGAQPAGGNTGLRRIPPRTLRRQQRDSNPSDASASTVPSTPSMPASTQSKQLSPEEQYILMEAERLAHKDDPNYPPLPPTPLSQQSSETPPPSAPTAR